MKTIARFQLPEEAHLFRSYLESQDIAAYVFDECLVQMAWHYSDAIGGVRVVVSECDYDEALGFFQSYSQAMRQPSEIRTEVRAWPLILLLSFLLGVPTLIFGRKEV